MHKELKILLNFGRTREYIDSIRYITNNSSGKMGIALYNALYKYSSNIITIIGDIDYEFNQYNKKVKNNIEMDIEMKKHFKNADIVICNAALNDFKLNKFYNGKITQRKSYKLNLVRNTDVLYNLGQLKTNQYLVGFSLQEKFNNLKIAKQKLKNKNLDVIIINTLNKMNNHNSEVFLLFKNNEIIKIPENNKENISNDLIKIIINDYKKHIL